MKLRNLCISMECKQFLNQHIDWLESKGLNPGAPFKEDDEVIYIPYYATNEQAHDVMRYVAKCILHGTI